MLNKLSQFLKNHIVGIIITGVIASIIATGLIGLIPNNDKNIQDDFVRVKTSENIEPAKTAKTAKEKKISPALKVTFTDGKSALVSYGYQTQLISNNAVRVVNEYGTQKSALTDLHSSIEGAMYSIMETLTSSYARKNRNEIREKVIKATQEAQNRTGHKVIELTIHSIQ